MLVTTHALGVLSSYALLCYSYKDYGKQHVDETCPSCSRMKS